MIGIITCLVVIIILLLIIILNIRTIQKNQFILAWQQYVIHGKNPEAKVTKKE